MIKLFTILSFFIFGKLAATNYYISATGSDAAAGTSTGTAWLTITKVNTVWAAGTFAPGDSILFKRGDTFYGTIVVTESGSSGSPMIIGAYGTGAKPIITGFTAVTAWTDLGSNIYESTSAVTALTTMNMVVFNDTFQIMGRWPKVTAANGGYLLYQTHSGSTSITSNAIASALSYVGGEVVNRKNAWIIDRGRVLTQNSTTVTFTPFPDGATWPLVDGNGFFFQNHQAACTVLGEWAYDSTSRKIRMNFIGATPASYTIKVSSVASLVDISSKNYITFDNLQFIGSNSKTFNINIADNLEIKNCDLDFAGVDAIWCNGNAGATNFSIHDNTINHTNNVAIDLGEGANCTIRTNTIRNTGIVAGMGVSSDKNYMVIKEIDNGAIVEYNRIINSGYIGIYFSGNDVLVRRNFVDSFCLVKTDGGGIYTYAGITNTNRSVIGNISINGIGNRYGCGIDLTHIYGGAEHGIYLDGDARNVIIDSNTTANCGSSGLLMNSPQGVTVTNNTFYNNTITQIEYSSLTYALSTLTVTGNIMFAKTADQLCLRMRLTYNSFATLGTINSNFYCRPIAEVQGITEDWDGSYTSNTPYNLGGISMVYVPFDGMTNWKFYSLDTWKTFSSKDAATVKTPMTITSVDSLRFEYNATNAAVVVDLPYNYMDARGVEYDGEITLQPYSSAVLIQNGAASVTTIRVGGRKAIVVQ